MPALRIIACDAASRARAGVLQTAHGEIRTPAFVPLATQGQRARAGSAEVAALDYDIVLGNTFHLFLSPGGELIERFGGLHRFMGWERAIITDSGGFQVFSMGHGTVADEIKGRRRVTGEGAILAIEEDGVRFRSYLDGSERFLSPEISMAVQAQLHSDIVLAFDECTPFHASREYTARSTERTHRWLERAVRWRAEHAGPPRSSTGSSRAGSMRTCGSNRPPRWSRAAPRGSPSAARWARRRRRCTRSSTGARARPSAWRRSAPATCSGSATSTT